MSSREIITLQFGHEANFVGTHFWNIQESFFSFGGEKSRPRDEIDHDVLFREGRNHLREVTYTPRLLLFDLKGSLRTLPESGGTLYGEAEGEVMWSSDVTLHKAPSPTKNEFLREVETEGDIDADRDRDETEEGEGEAAGVTKNVAEDVGRQDLEEDVTVWSDFLGTQLHSRSLTVLRDFCHGGDPGTEGAFDHFVQGWDLFRPGSDLWETFADDSLRFFAEECDYLQGFHLLADCSGFSGCAARALEHLNDEFSGKCRFAFPLFPVRLFELEDNSRFRGAQLLSAVLAITEAERHVTALCPLGLSAAPWRSDPAPNVFPWLNFDLDRSYHTSAVLAASLDSLSLSYRLKNAPHTLETVTSLAAGGRNILSLRCALPLPLSENAPLFDALRLLPHDQLFTPLCPFSSSTSKTDPLIISVRGASSSNAKSSSGVQEVLLEFASEHFGPRTLAFSSELRQLFKRPFPRIFGQCKPERVLPDSAAGAVLLQCAQDTGTSLQELRALVQASPLRRCLPAAAADVLEPDDVTEMLEHFAEICEAYSEEPLR